MGFRALNSLNAEAFRYFVMRANVLTTDSPAAARHPLLEGEEEDGTYRTDMTNRMMKAIRILMMVVGMISDFFSGIRSLLQI